MHKHTNPDSLTQKSRAREREGATDDTHVTHVIHAQKQNTRVLRSELLSQRVRIERNHAKSHDNSADSGPKTESAAVRSESAAYESEIHRKVVNALIRAGYWPETLVQGAGTPPRRNRPVWFGKTKGAPDIDVIGENVHLEVKRPGEYPEPHQRAYHARARRFGAIVAVVRSEQEALDVMEGVKALRGLLRTIERLMWL